MKIFCLILLLSFAPMAWAQIESEKVVTKQITTAASDEAKSLLLHQAVLEVINQYSTELGINFDHFSERLKQKNDAAFKDHKKRLFDEKFGKNFATELTPEQNEEFSKSVEATRADFIAENFKLSSLLDSYNFKQIENKENVWSATVSMNLNRSKLEQLVKRLFSAESRAYSRLNLITEINLMDLTWEELGLDKSTTFSDPIMSSWNKWLMANQPSNVDEVVVCTGSCLSAYENWQQLPQEEGMQVSEEFLNALWLKVSFNLRKIRYSTEINEWQFEWDGSVILLDANTKRVVSSATIFTQGKTWRGLDQKAINSTLASAMYRSPLDAFNNITKKVQQLPRLNRLSRLVVQGHRHLGDVLFLMRMLRNAGEGVKFDVQLDTFSQNGAQLLCFYQGEEKSFTDLLSQVKELKSSHSYRLVNEFTGIHHVLKLIAE